MLEILTTPLDIRLFRFDQPLIFEYKLESMSAFVNTKATGIFIDCPSLLFKRALMLCLHSLINEDGVSFVPLPVLLDTSGGVIPVSCPQSKAIIIPFAVFKYLRNFGTNISFPLLTRLFDDYRGSNGGYFAFWKATGTIDLSKVEITE